MKVVSPYLTIYKPQVSSIFSIVQRITGVVLVLSLVITVLLLRLEVILLGDYMYYSFYYFIFKSSYSGFLWFIMVMFLIFNLGYHFSFGLRYLLWDRFGMSKISVDTLSISVVNFLILFIVFVLVFIVLLLLY